MPLPLLIFDVVHSIQLVSLMQGSAAQKRSVFGLSLAALGVVYGDIGTSPLYAVRESLRDVPITTVNVLGVLSLIFWVLILIVSIEYLMIVFKADNEGEGGTLALYALLKRRSHRALKYFFAMGIFAAGLLLGDAMLTPAISVLGAVEGLSVIDPALTYWVVPLSAIILIVLFMFQSSGTAKIGFAFGPIIFFWFLTIGILGLQQIMITPQVLKAINPYYAYEFLHQNGIIGFKLLGGVFLVVTGGEALYADLGHFGKGAIRRSWFCLVLPSLLLNYFGQGAGLLNDPAAIVNPFYKLAPDWMMIPMLILSTMATIIASQAVISATFSLTRQAVLLGLYPRLEIIQTSEREQGQIYIPQMNFIMMVGTLLLVLTFKSSNALAHAYGIAVNLVMMLTTVMVAFAARKLWRWNIVIVVGLFSLFLSIDSVFFAANLDKLFTGGWVPITFALFCAFIMYTWREGMEYVRETFFTKKEAFSKYLKQLNYRSLNRLPNLTAVFITDVYDQSGGYLLRFLTSNRVLPEHVLIVSYVVENIPYVSIENRFEVKRLNVHVCQLILHYGFKDIISIPKALNQADENTLLPFPIDIDTVTYLVEVPNIIAAPYKHTLTFFWQEKLFAFLMRNYSVNLNINFYHLPPTRTMAIGGYHII